MKEKAKDIQLSAYDEQEFHHYQSLAVYPEYHFETHDIGIGAALMCCGFEPPAAFMLSSGVPSFIFKFDYEGNSLSKLYGYSDVKQTPEELAERYSTNTLSVNPKTFCEQLKTLEDKLRKEYDK